MLSQFLPELLTALLPLITIIVTILAKLLGDWLKKKIDNQTIENVVIRLNDASRAAVLEVLQTTVGTLKEKSTDGKLDKEDAKAAAAAALASVKSHLGPKGIQELMQIMGLKTEAEVEKVIKTRVEAQVFNVRQEYPFTGVRIQQTTPTA